MVWWQTIVCSALTTLIGIIVTDIVVRIKTSSVKEIEKKKTAQLAQIRLVIQDELQPLHEEIREVRRDVEEVKNSEIVTLSKANRDSLRNQLFNLYDRCDHQGYKTSDDVENESEMFDSYKTLGGNHGADARHNLFIKIPTKSAYSRTHEDNN